MAVPISVVEVEVLSPSLAEPVATVQNSVEFLEVPVRLGQSRRALAMTHASWTEYLQ